MKDGLVNARIFALIIAIVGMLVASGIPDSNGRGAPLPTLSIISPTPNEVIGNGTPVAIVFAVTNFNLTEPGDGTSSPNSVHVDLFVDDTLIAQTSVNTIVLPLPSGPHTIRLRLVTDNGSALNPDVNASVPVMVTRGPTGGTPGLSIVFPQEGALLGTDWTLSFRVTNFVLVPPGGPVGVPNEGHIVVRLDSASYAVLTDGLARADRPRRDFPARGHESLRRGGGPLPVNPRTRERPGHRQWDAGNPELRGR